TPRCLLLRFSTHYRRTGGNVKDFAAIRYPRFATASDNAPGIPPPIPPLNVDFSDAALRLVDARKVRRGVLLEGSSQKARAAGCLLALAALLYFECVAEWTGLEPATPG